MQLLLFIGGGSFILLTFGSLLLSIKHLRNRRDYRFYRFFAYESVLALFLFNLNRLAVYKGIWKEALFWIGISLSIIVLFAGYLQLKQVSDSNGSIDNTTRFVNKGIFKWIRHPFYASFLYFALSMFFKSVTVYNTILFITACILLYITARFEEFENMRKFGYAYQDYIKNTNMFLPYIF